jgi:cyclase
MLKKRLMPTLLLKGPGLVKGVGFDSWRRIGPAVQAARVFDARQVDELVLLDIAATPEGRGPDMATIAAVAEDCFMPLNVGGGVRDLATIRELLRIGADKVVIGTAAFDVPGLIKRAAVKFGSQCITVALDVKHGLLRTHCGAGTTNMDADIMAAYAQALGAGEILLTSIERDGTMDGYDLDLIRDVSAVVSIPVIASGGAGRYADFEAAFAAGADAVAASAMFQFTEQTPLAAKQHLHRAGVPVRL